MDLYLGAPRALIGGSLKGFSRTPQLRLPCELPTRGTQVCVDADLPTYLQSIVRIVRTGPIPPESETTWSSRIACSALGAAVSNALPGREIHHVGKSPSAPIGHFRFHQG